MAREWSRGELWFEGRVEDLMALEAAFGFWGYFGVYGLHWGSRFRVLLSGEAANLP